MFEKNKKSLRSISIGGLMAMGVSLIIPTIGSAKDSCMCSKLEGNKVTCQELQSLGGRGSGVESSRDACAAGCQKYVATQEYWYYDRGGIDEQCKKGAGQNQVYFTPPKVVD